MAEWTTLHFLSAMLSVQMDMLSSYEQTTWPSGQHFTQKKKKAHIRPEVQHSAVLKVV